MSLTIPDPTPDAPLFVFGDDHDWVIAHSEADASVVWNEHTGAVHDDDADPWVQLDDDVTLKIAEDDGSISERLVTEWAALDGRGFLCSENY